MNSVSSTSPGLKSLNHINDPGITGRTVRGVAGRVGAGSGHRQGLDLPSVARETYAEIVPEGLLNRYRCPDQLAFDL